MNELLIFGKPLGTMTRRELRRERREDIARLKGLFPEQTKVVDAYLAEHFNGSKAAQESRQYSALMHIEDNGVEHWLAWMEQRRETERAAETRRLQEAEKHAKAKAARILERKTAIAAAIAAGEPVPAMYRPVGAKCATCYRPLRDPESVRLGLGPECRRAIAF